MISRKNVGFFFKILSVTASLQFIWAGFHCHTQGLSAGFALIAVNMVRSPCVNGVCRKVYQSAPFLHPTIMFAIIFKMFVVDKHVCKPTVLCSCKFLYKYIYRLCI